jgi:hypothetical protein
MDIDAHIAMNQDEYEEWERKISKLSFPFNVGIGTNEDVDISRNQIKVKEISEEDYNTLLRVGLKKRGFINCIDIESLGWDDDDY